LSEAAVAVSLTVVGPRDTHLEEFIRSCDLPLVISWLPEFAALLAPTATAGQVVLLDLRRSGRVPADLALLKQQHPATNVILLAATLDPKLMLDGMRAGVSECLAEPLVAADFVAAIGRLGGQRTAAPSGPVFAFVGAKGGVGATTAAVNVATSLAKLSNGGAVMIDLHLAYGDAAVYLGADTRFSVVDAIENLHRLDSAFFKSLLVHTPSGLDLLASSDRPLMKPIEHHRLATVVEFAATQFSYTILDVPRSDLGVLDCLDRVSTIVVVANQELATVRNAGRLAAALRGRYKNARVMTVINRTDRGSEIGHQDVERAVGGAIAHQFPSDYRRALHAMNKGRPLALDNHNDLAASFKALAHELAGIKAEKRPAERSSGLLGLFPARKP
jgi:pilus assembly protein CpaE